MRHQPPQVVWPETVFALTCAGLWCDGRAFIPRWERIH
jgi:hypothetical protein